MGDAVCRKPTSGSTHRVADSTNRLLDQRGAIHPDSLVLDAAGLASWSDPPEKIVLNYFSNIYRSFNIYLGPREFYFSAK